MLFGLTQLGGLVLITGEIGCGKTMLAETLRGMLSGGGYRVVAVPNPPRTSTRVPSVSTESAPPTTTPQASCPNTRGGGFAAGKRPNLMVESMGFTAATVTWTSSSPAEGSGRSRVTSLSSE